jgi:hypothetical protein
LPCPALPCLALPYLALPYLALRTAGHVAASQFCFFSIEHSHCLGHSVFSDLIGPFGDVKKKNNKKQTNKQKNRTCGVH